MSRCVLVLVVALSAVVVADEPRPLDAFLEAEWEWGLRESPTFATSLGDRRYNHLWPDVSLSAIERRHAHQREALQRLLALEVGSPAEELNRQLFRKQLEWELEEYPFQWYLAPMTARDGIQDESSLADSINFDSVEDYEAWIARLRALPEYVDQTIELLREGLKQNLTQPRIVMQRVPPQLRRQIVEDPAQSLYYKPFRSLPDSLPAETRERLQTAAKEAVAARVVPAYQRFLEFFEERYLPGCREDVGLWSVPRGQELYALRARQFTTTELTPQQIHDIGLSEVRRIRGEMEKIVSDVKFQGSFREFLNHLRTDPKFYYTSPDDLLNGYLALCKRVDPQLPKLFKTLPRIPYGIEPIPAHMAPDTTAAYYRPPAADGSRAGTYFVNLYRPDMRPKYEMEALSLHEAVPGHHLQIAIATELEGLPRFRRFGSVTAYIEGWGLYSESLGAELGLYKDPYSKFGQLTYEMWRAVRLVVDTGMHSLKWTRPQAIDYFLENTAKSELDIVNEVDRYIAWPGQALAYKIGELKILELRARAITKLGGKFDIREFHDVVLRNGPVPLDVLEREVDSWIARVQP